MAEVIEPPEHKAVRSALRKLEKQLSRLRIIRFGPIELEEAQICALPMRLHENGYPEFEPCFFKPYPADFLPNPDNLEDEDEEFPDYDRETQLSDFYNRPTDCARGVTLYLDEY